MPKLRVTLTQATSNFVDLPAVLIQEILTRPQVRVEICQYWLMTSAQAVEPTVTVRISSGSNTVYAGWGGGTAKSGRIGVPSVLASCLEIADNEEIDVSVYAGVPAANQVNVEPVSEDDWEIMVQLPLGFCPNITNPL